MSVVEEWRPIAGAEEYEVSNLGRVRSWVNSGKAGRRVTPRLLTPQVSNPYGHLKVRYGRRPGRGRWVHHLVLEAFVGPRPTGCQAAHGNGISADNRLENLRWATPTENNADKKHHGTYQFGERMPLAKLTDEKVREMRRRYATGSVTQQKLAEEYGVSGSVAQRVIKRKIWTHVA